MTKDEQARARLVEIALHLAEQRMKHTGPCRPDCIVEPVCVAYAARARAEMRNPKVGSWCAAGLTAAMKDAGLVVPAPGTPARRGAVALLDFVVATSTAVGGLVWGRSTHHDAMSLAQPGDIIAWLQHPPPDPAGWRRGHVAVIVAVDDESITTVGWNEGVAPGRVMKRRLWRDPERKCGQCAGLGRVPIKRAGAHVRMRDCETCKGTRRVPRSSTVLYRRPGGPYGVARPVVA